MVLTAASTQITARIHGQVPPLPIAPAVNPTAPTESRIAAPQNSQADRTCLITPKLPG
jgi:hypothetical protein